MTDKPNIKDLEEREGETKGEWIDRAIAYFRKKALQQQQEERGMQDDMDSLRKD